MLFDLLFFSIQKNPVEWLLTWGTKVWCTSSACRNIAWNLVFIIPKARSIMERALEWWALKRLAPTPRTGLLYGVMSGRGVWRHRYPPSARMKCPGGGYSDLEYSGLCWRTLESWTDPGQPTYVSMKRPWWSQTACRIMEENSFLFL